jgi:serine/threonine-protein kinase PknG
MKCQHPGCSGTIEDGFCDVCGRAPATASAAHVSSASLATGTSTGTSSRSHRTSPTNVGTTSRRRAGLGAGMVDLPAVPAFDPLQAVLADPKVPERRRLCPALVYREPNGDILSQSDARARGIPPDALEDCNAKLNFESGFCPICGQEYSFEPSLKPGDVVDRKYEVKGPVAFGGLGWIYLAWARHLARWVIIKGLLNIKDATQRELARTEARSLSAFKHPNIVQVYDLIEGDAAHGQPDYIVMEYVGGRTLMQLRRERGPLPLTEACAYILGILPAFAYIHQQGRVYMDFKPENGMLEPATGDESERIVLIDMGAVHQAFADDAGAGALYATSGYSSPEGAPTPQHDIYTIGRTLAVLTGDFRFGSDFRDKLPPADSVPVWASHPAFYRLLLKATRADPDDRFQTAAELEDQLRGVLRLVVSETGVVPIAESTIFSGDVLELSGAQADGLSWRTLPVTRTNPTDPAAPLIEAANRERDLSNRVTMLRNALSQVQLQESVDLPLQLVVAMIEQLEFAEAEQQLLELEQADPFNWRVRWLRGKLRLAQKRAAEAQQLFDGVDAELPGELAPKLATAVAAELNDDPSLAADLYDRVSRTNPNFSTATFGLARCRLKLGDRHGAVAAYQRVPATSSRYVAAQLALARALVDASAGPPGLDDLTRASEILGGLNGQDVADSPELHLAAASLFLSAAEQLDRGKLSPNGTRLLGRACIAAELRKGAEERLRRCARYARNDAERISLVDRANAVRPWTLT